MTETSSPAESDQHLGADLRRMVDAAEAHARDGRPNAAAGLYQILLDVAPEHTGALTFLGMRAFHKGDYETSRNLMKRAVRTQPDDAMLRQNLGMAYHATGQQQLALDSFRKAISLQPGFAICHFQIGRILHDIGRLPEAVAAYQQGLRIDPRLGDPQQLDAAPPMIRDLAQRAGRAFEQQRIELQKRAADAVLAEVAGEVPTRLRQFLDQEFAQTPPDYAHPLQRPSFHYYPGLTPRQWYERDEFDWMTKFEAAFDAVRAELAAVLESQSDLAPYVAHSGYTPEEWRKLAGSADWNAYHLLQGGEKLAEHCRQCPQTLAALQHTPLVRAQGHAPEAFFSILAPGTHIPPHFGLANTKLAVHLPLIIPPDCGIRVGGEARGWQAGECLIFDDSFEHEAWNDSGETRVVLIFEIWHPDLTDVERRTIQALIKAGDDFYRTLSGPPF